MHDTVTNPFCSYLRPRPSGNQDGGRRMQAHAKRNGTVSDQAQISLLESSALHTAEPHNCTSPETILECGRLTSWPPFILNLRRGAALRSWPQNGVIPTAKQWPNIADDNRKLTTVLCLFENVVVYDGTRVPSYILIST
ncbi:unnamed protein product [Spodoptera littoralis]|uniref:Uncharacterized protein n=1 Tax=Spodoptera littoralis TaxID=7109 RepID=A0A9P0I1G2_SPOLI|nr:unnamed protein product [Spodoptera littoralis]CAH1637691.1 unnamed protein product [Spodoptera littoralis]